MATKREWLGRERRRKQNGKETTIEYTCETVDQLAAYVGISIQMAAAEGNFGYDCELLTSLQPAAHRKSKLQRSYL